MKARWLVSGVALLLLACGGDHPRDAGVVAGNEPLSGTTWRLLAFTDTPAVPIEGEVTLSFITDSTFAGGAGCNRYFGGYHLVAADSVALGPAGSTMMACPGALMEQEARFLSALATVGRFGLQGDTLVLEGPRGPALSFLPATSPP
jgi:heat shock protein HslJ